MSVFAIKEYQNEVEKIIQQQWSNWGKQLMNLHINYEQVLPYLFQQKEVTSKQLAKAKLKAVKESGSIH